MYLLVNVHRLWRRRRLWLAGALAGVLLTLSLAAAGAHGLDSPTAAADCVAVPIVMYHSLYEKGQGAYVISPTLFEQDLGYLKENGYETVTLADLIAYVDTGAALPPKPVMLTFDDGFYNNFHYGHPLLKQYGMRAVLSPIGAVTQFYSDHPQEQDKPAYSYVTFAQLRQMAESGVWEIQNHSYDMHHTNEGGRHGAAQKTGESDAAYVRALADDLTAAQTLLSEQAGVTPTAFTYPFGAFSAASQPVLKALGLRASLSCEQRISRISRDPESLWRLGRFLRPAGVDSATFFGTLFKEE